MVTCSIKKYLRMAGELLHAFSERSPLRLSHNTVAADPQYCINALGACLRPQESITAFSRFWGVKMHVVI